MTLCLPFLLIEIGMAKWKSRDFFSESCLGHLHHALESWLAERAGKPVFICAVLMGSCGVCVKLGSLSLRPFLPPPTSTHCSSP